MAQHLRKWPRLESVFRSVRAYKIRYTHWRFDSRYLRNVNRSAMPIRRRALLVYLVRPFLIKRNSVEFVLHQNRWACIEIARLLGELGYVVDALNFDNYRTHVDSDYDLLIGFGRAEDLAMSLPPHTVKILLSTGTMGKVANQRESERVEEVNRKRGCHLKPMRQASDNPNRLSYFDAIACIGNDVTANTYRPVFSGPIYSWNNHCYDKWLGVPSGKNFEEAKHSFIYFAGAGQILIGLHLVLDAFVNRPHLRLFVCGPFEQEDTFADCFHTELFCTQNIVPVGWVTVGSQRYFDLMRKCCATIYPACGGGSPGSVIVAMSQGVIPIVSKEAGIDTGDFGFTLRANTPDEIGNTIEWLSQQSGEWHQAAAHGVVTATKRDYSQAAFSRNFKEMLISAIIDNRPQVSSD